jgi:polysaccharide chain length determinant protein (PEP-CTERM system associated)
MDVNEGLQFGDLLRVARRRRHVIGLTLGIVFLGSIFVTAVLPNRYEASTTLLIEPQTISKNLVEASPADSDLNNRLHLMTMQILSRPRLSRIIDDFGLYPEESQEMTREEVIELMREQIRVEPVLPELDANLGWRREVEINTFRIFFRDRNAKTAANVANRLGNDFIEEHIKNRAQTSGDTSEFVESELTRLAGRIAEVEERITAVKARNSGSLPEDLRTNQELREDAYDRLRNAQGELTKAESDAAFYRQQALASKTLVNPYDKVSPEQHLETLDLQLAELQARGFTDKHPDVIATRHEIELVRASLEHKAGQDGTGPKSQAQQSAEAEESRALLRAEAARKEIAGLQAQIEEIEQRIARTPRVAEQVEALDREYQALSASYQEFSHKRLEAAVAANMERQVKGERFRVLEPAVAPLSADSPNRPLLLAFGLLLGLGCGVAFALIAESSDTSFDAVRPLQTALGIPVLAAIPSIWLDSDRAELQHRRIRQAMIAGLVALAVFVGSGIAYVWVNGPPPLLAGWIGGENEPPPAPEVATNRLPR